jgi:glucokinase
VDSKKQPAGKVVAAPQILILCCVTMPDFSIGVDLGGTNLRIAAVSRDGQLLERVGLEAKAKRGPDDVINDMCTAVLRLTEKYRSDGQFLGAGMGIPGLVDIETGTVRISANLPGWSKYPVRAEIERRLKVPVFIENDAKFAALGEKWMGAGRNVSTMGILTLGTGIGGAIVLNEKIFRGTNEMAGEFGHVPIERDGYPCGCGSHGCAEQYASASAVIRNAREAIAGGSAPALAEAVNAGKELNARLVYDLATQGDEVSRNIFHRFGKDLGFLLSGLLNSLNLDMFVIGGGVASAWDAFAPAMFAELRERSLVYAAATPQEIENAAKLPAEGVKPKMTIVTRALLGSDAGLYGAARAPLMAG